MDKQFSDLIILLASGINQRLMYFDNHPQVQALGRDFCRQLGEYLENSGQAKFHFGIFKGKFIRHGKYLVGPSIAGRSLISFAELLGCGGFAFCQPFTPEQAVAFFRVASQQRDSLANQEESQGLLRQNGLGNVEILPLLIEMPSCRQKSLPNACTWGWGSRKQ